MIREREIVYEVGDHWVRIVPRGRLKGTFEVYRNELTHAVRCAVIGYRGADGKARAIAEAERRETSD